MNQYVHNTRTYRHTQMHILRIHVHTLPQIEKTVNSALVEALKRVRGARIRCV